VTLTIKPAKENTGYVFVRTDLEGNPQIEADANYVVSTDRGTTLEKSGVKIYTCEHVLAALVGMDVDNAILEMNNAEPPIMDGSSKFFVEAIEKAGVVEQEQPREYFAVTEVVNFTDPQTGSEITIIPADTYEVTTMVDFGTNVLGTQNAVLKNISNFKNEISSARTFSFLHELEMLLDAGLDPYTDGVLAVLADDTLRLQRAMARDGASEEAVRARMQHQMPQEELAQRADFLIYNDEAHPLTPQLDSLFDKLLGWAFSVAIHSNIPIFAPIKGGSQPSAQIRSYMLKTILSISGKPGLYRLLSSGKNTLIVESLQTQKRIPVLPKDRVVSLGDISMFTDGEDIALSEVLTRLHEKQAGVAVSEELLKDSDALRNSFGEVIPNFDRERVYTSDIKKLYTWYNILIEAGITDFADQDEAE